jgi:hypothetical protein
MRSHFTLTGSHLTREGPSYLYSLTMIAWSRAAAPMVTTKADGVIPHSPGVKPHFQRLTPHSPGGCLPVQLG